MNTLKELLIHKSQVVIHRGKAVLNEIDQWNEICFLWNYRNNNGDTPLHLWVILATLIGNSTADKALAE